MIYFRLFIFGLCNRDFIFNFILIVAKIFNQINKIKKDMPNIYNKNYIQQKLKIKKNLNINTNPHIHAARQV